MTNLDLRKDTKKNLFILFLIFAIGLTTEIVINLYSNKLTTTLENQLLQSEIKNKIGQDIIKNIYKLESNFFNLSAFPNLHVKKILLKNIEETQNNIVSLLDIINKGGTLKQFYDLNDVGQADSTVLTSYHPIKTNQFVFEQTDITRKIKNINTALLKISSKIDNMNDSLKNDHHDLIKNIASLKLEIKFLAPIFQRLKENANNIIFKNNLDHQGLTIDVSKSKQAYFWIQVTLTLIVTLLLLWLFKKLSRNIEFAFEETAKNKDYVDDILKSQTNITVVSDGKQILDASGGFFDFFDDYPNLDNFKAKHPCVCDKFIQEEGYLYKFEDKNWLEYLLENTQTMHKVKMKKNGRDFIFQIVADKSKKYQRTIITLHDITKTEKMYAELAIEKDKAVSATQAKGEFLANMSHEIRTPLNAILGFINLLQEKKFDDETHNYLNTIDSSGHSLLTIINDILDFSKIESGKFELSPIKFDPKHEFCIVSDLFRAKASEQNITHILSFDDNLPPVIKADILRIKQVISNLLSNAIKFSKQYKTVNLDIKFNQQSSLLTVSVTDEGIGLTEKQQATIFDAFSQAETSTTRKYGGTGLGLSISAHLIELLGGKLEVKSQYGKGSCFYFTVPVKVVKGNLKSKTENIKTHFSGHILLVEDNKTNQMLMSAILKKQGLTFDIANDGLEAIAAVKTSKYDLVLMDENMPNLNGIEATKQIRKIEKIGVELPIVALTANAMIGDKEKFISAGMDDYLTKPVNIKELQSVFASFLWKEND